MACRAAPSPPSFALTAIVYFSVLLTATPIIFLSNTVSAGAEDGAALLRFKATLSGLKADLPSWIPGPPPCHSNHTTWEGVICFNDHVRGVQLENMDLVGHLDLQPLVALTGLRTISFMHNNLDGPFPDLNGLGALKAVYLSGNNFSGEIQGGAFAGMRSLRNVFISNNGLSGSIPWSLASLGKLLEVRLDHNNFSGRIPEFHQPGLVMVDLSFNALEGLIPQRFSKMDPVFFKGNPMLCGAPLMVSCREKDRPKQRSFSGWLLTLIIMACILVFLVLLYLFSVVRRRREEKTVVMGRPSSKKKTGDHAVVNADKLHLNSAEQRHHRHHHSIRGRLVFLQEGSGRFELHDLLRASAEVLGSGNFGSSFKAVLSAGPTVVVKRFKEMNSVGREDFNEHMRRLGRLSHTNVLPLLAYYYKKDEKLLVTQFIANGSLAHMLHGNRGSTLPPLDWPARLKIVKGVTRGLGYLYEELRVLGLPHGHLKSSNVLLNENLDPLLTDYALVPVMNAAHASQVMVAYKSPEVTQRGRPSRKSDVWSLGILILEILTGKFPSNFLHKGSSTGADLATWVSSVTEAERNSEDVFDCDMKETANGQREMHELLKIGLDCCLENVEARLEMREALERIEQLSTRSGSSIPAVEEPVSSP